MQNGRSIFVNYITTLQTTGKNSIKDMNVMNSKYSKQNTGADPGFPVGGGADPLGGVPIYDFVKFFEKLHEIENILGRRGGRAPGAPR